MLLKLSLVSVNADKISGVKSYSSPIILTLLAPKGMIFSPFHESLPSASRITLKKF